MARLIFRRELSIPANPAYENDAPARPGKNHKKWAPALLRGSLILALLTSAACAEIKEQVFPSSVESVSLLFDAQQLITQEWGGSDSFTLLLSGAPPMDFELKVTSSDPMEGVVSPESIHYSANNWNTPQTVTVTGVDDDLIDGNKNFSVNIEITEDSEPFFNIGEAISIDAVNYDDEIAALLVQSIQTKFSEADGSGEIMVSLTRQPNDDVVVDVTCTDPYKALLSTKEDSDREEVSLVFTPQDWNHPQWVILVGQDNDIPDGDQVIFLAVSVNPDTTIDTSGYLDAETQRVELTVEDDEYVGATVYLARYCAAFAQMEE